MRLGRGQRPNDERVAPPPRSEHAIGAGEIYRVYFHGPAFRVIDTAWRSDGGAVSLFAAALPAGHRPAARATTLAGPRLIELCFQTAGVLQLGTTGTLGLPRRVDRVRLLREPAEEGRLFAVVEPDGSGHQARVVDEQGRVYLAIEGYRTVELPAALDERALAAFRAVMSGTAEPVLSS